MRAHGVYLVIFISLCFNALGRSKVSQSTSQRVENEKNISQIVRVCEVCVQNGERVSRNDKSCHICMRLKNMGLCLYIFNNCGNYFEKHKFSGVIDLVKMQTK